jgi:hypothetical protein
MKIPFVKNSEHQCIAGIVVVPTLDGKYILYVLWEWEKPAREGRFKGYKNYVTDINDESIQSVMNSGKAMTPNEYEAYFPSVLKASKS